MTTSKINQVRQMFSAILESYGVDNLPLEGKLAQAACTFFEEVKQGKDPVKARQDIVDGVLHYAGAYRQYELMSERIEKALRLHPDGGDKWNDVVDHCNKKLEIGQTIEAYAEWASRDVFNSPKAHQIAQNPRLIITTWPQAFVKTNVKELELIY